MNGETLVDCPPVVFHTYMDGYGAGYAAGIERGRELERADLAALHRSAFEVVRGAASGRRPTTFAEDAAARSGVVA